MVARICLERLGQNSVGRCIRIARCVVSVVSSVRSRVVWYTHLLCWVMETHLLGETCVGAPLVAPCLPPGRCREEWVDTTSSGEGPSCAQLAVALCPRVPTRALLILSRLVPPLKRSQPRLRQRTDSAEP